MLLRWFHAIPSNFDSGPTYPVILPFAYYTRNTRFEFVLVSYDAINFHFCPATFPNRMLLLSTKLSLSVIARALPPPPPLLPRTYIRIKRKMPNGMRNNRNRSKNILIRSGVGRGSSGRVEAPHERGHSAELSRGHRSERFFCHHRFSPYRVRAHTSPSCSFLVPRNFHSLVQFDNN